MNDLIYLGNDLGAGGNKLFGPHGGLQVLSTVAVDDGRTLARMPGLTQRRPPLRIHTDAGSFFVGQDAHSWGRPVENLDHDRFNGSPELIALLYGTLTRYVDRYGPFSAPLHLTVGLPIETLSGPADQTTATASAVRRWLQADHAWEADGRLYSAVVAEANVTSQPVGAYFDHFLDESGAYLPGRKAALKREVGVLSIGMNTIEMLTVCSGSAVQRFSAGHTAGVRRLLELVNADNLYSLGELDAQLRAGRLDVTHALPVWGREVTGLVERRWGAAARRFAAVLVVGGGAILLRDVMMARFDGRAVIPADPVLSIARGLYKLALYQSRRRRARADQGAA